MPDDLMRRIRLGEDSVLEFKGVRIERTRVRDPDRGDFADELAAMANSAGGTLILGVDDATREIQGIPLDSLDTVEGWVREICNDVLKPALDAVILKLELEDSAAKPVPVLRIDVPRSLFVHRSPGGYFRRIGSSKRELPPDALARLFQERSQSRVIRFDESLVPGTRMGHLEYALTQRFLRDADLGLRSDGAEDTDDNMLRKLRIVADDPEGRTCLTLAGTLLCNSWDAFANLLNRHRVDTLADVRSVPASRFNPQFNRSVLSASLRALASDMPNLAPTKELLHGYRQGSIGWDAYEASFMDLMRARRVEDSIPKDLLDGGLPAV